MKVNAETLCDPNGNVFSSCWMAASKAGLPPPIPSSTWIPKIPSSLLGWLSVAGVLRTKQQGSKGHASKPSLCNSVTNAQYQRYGASIRPYAPLFSRQICWELNPMAFLSSGTGSIAIILSACGRPWRNAAFISKDLIFHECDAIVCKTTILEVLLSVGLSLGTSSNWGSK